MAIKQPNIAPFDADAQRFILAAGLTRYVDKRAINYLVQNLKSNGLWARCTAIYPMVGGNAYSCKLNLKNPIDSDAAYRLTFTAITFSYRGITGNGTTGFANTNLNCSTVMSLNDNHMAFYSRTNSTSTFDTLMGGYTTPFFLLCGGRTLDNLSFYNEGGASYSTTTVMRYDGLFLGTRTASGNSNVFGYRNGSLFTGGASAASGSAALPNLNLYICGANGSGTVNSPSIKQCAYASLGLGLTAAQVFIYTQIVQQFQIILQRAV